MKDETERRNLLYSRAIDAISSKEFRHRLMHHTDIDIREIQCGFSAIWITLEDGSYYKIAIQVTKSPFSRVVELRDERILQELTDILDRADGWALPSDLAENKEGFSLVKSIRAAVLMRRVGLALDRYGDLGPHQPELSEEAQNWGLDG